MADSGKESGSNEEFHPVPETPISKYLANLERTRGQYLSPFPRPRPGPGVGGVSARLNFDDSFFQDASMLNISPELDIAGPRSAKRRRSMYFTMTEGEDVDVEEVQKKNSELEKLLRQTQAELINVRASQTKLEHLNNEMKRSHMEKIIQYEKTESEEKTKCKNAVDKASEIEKQLKKLEKKEQETSELAAERKATLSTKLAAMEEKLAGLQRENFQLKQNLTMETLKTEETRRKLQTELTETEMGAEKWIVDSQIMKDQLSLTQSQLAACQSELKTAKLDACKYQEIKNKYDSALSANEASASERMIQGALVRKWENMFINEKSENLKLQQTLKKVQEENNILRSTMKEEMILQEKITSLESQTTRMAHELKDKGACEAERNILQDELKLWRHTSTKLEANCLTPLSLEKVVRQMQNQLIEYKHENSTLQHRCENSTRLATTLQAESASLREQLKIVKDEKEKLTGDMKKMSRRLVLIVKDRDGLRELKESYEKEFDGLISEPLKERIEQLQKIVLEYEAMFKEDTLARKPCSECEQRSVQLESLQSRLDETIREKDLLSQTLSNQTIDDETGGVKIVAFANNPSMLTVEARLKECLALNEVLKEKLRKYEEDTLAGITDEDVLQEKKKLEDQLRLLERKHEILTQSYDYETVQLTQACSKLFGYYVTLVREPQNQIRLQSAYSTCPDHVFIFQEAENNDMMLLETPILDHFRDDIERFLITEGSIPAFLSSVTITYTQGLGQQLSVSEDDQNITVMAAAEPLPPATLQTGPGSSEVQIQIQGQDSSTDDESEGEPEYEEGSEESEGDQEPDEDEEPQQDESEPEDEEDRYDQDEEDDDDSDVVMID